MRCLLVAALSIALSGCAAPAYRQVFQEKPAGNYREFAAPLGDLYSAVTKVMCSRSFIIESEDKEKGFVLGKRSFQRGRQTIVLLIQGKFVGDKNGRSTVFVNAIETTESVYVSDRTRFLLFVLPLPGGGKETTTVKTAERTVQDHKFYSDFFSEVEKELALISAQKTAQSESVKAPEHQPAVAAPISAAPIVVPQAPEPKPVKPADNVTGREIITGPDTPAPEQAPSNTTDG